MAETTTTVLKPGEVKDGKSSTEHALAWAAKISGILMVLLGILAEALGWGSGEGTSLGSILMILGMIQSTLASMGYVGFRSLVKMNASKAIAHVAAKEAEARAMEGPSGNE